jgi:hypothetical protein
MVYDKGWGRLSASGTPIGRKTKPAENLFHLVGIMGFSIPLVIPLYILVVAYLHYLYTELQHRTLIRLTNTVIWLGQSAAQVYPRKSICVYAGYPSANCHLFIPFIMRFWLAAGKELGNIILQRINWWVNPWITNFLFLAISSHKIIKQKLGLMNLICAQVPGSYP